MPGEDASERSVCEQQRRVDPGILRINSLAVPARSRASLAAGVADPVRPLEQGSWHGGPHERGQRTDDAHGSSAGGHV